jgi:uroporphyrinogen decarboxylase
MAAHMTSRQRLLSAIRHEEPDRVPVSPRIAAFLAVHYGSSSWMHHLKAAREFGFDLMLPVASPVPAFFHAPQLAYRCLPPEVVVRQETKEQDGGVTVRRTFDTPAGPLSDETFLAPPGREYGVSPSPVKRAHLVKDRDDLDRLRYLLPDPAALQLADYHEIARLVGDDGIVEVTFNPPLDHFLGDVRGLPQLMIDYHLDRPFFDQLFATFQRYSLALLEAVLEDGVRYIFGTWYYASLSAGWSPTIFRTCFVPLIRAHANLVHRYGGIYHAYDDGKMMRTLGHYVDAGADVVETLTPPPVGDVDLVEAKRRYGDRTCLKGYVDLLYVLKMGTPELVERTVRQAIDVAAPGGGFILGTSDSIREGTPMANLHAYFDAAHTYGAYR